MDFLISLFKSGAWGILIIAGLFATYFITLKLIIFIGQLFDAKSMYMSIVDIAEKSTEVLINAFKKYKLIMIIVLVAFMFSFAYVDYESVSIPIRFEKEKTKRYTEIIQRLKDIRTAQNAYKDAKGKFANNFDDLINFVNNDSLPIARNLGSYDEDYYTEQQALDSGIIITHLPDTLTAERAVQLGLVVRDTVKIPVKESIFNPNFVADSLRYVPYSGVEFKIGAGEVMTGSEVKVKVFEVYDPDPFDIWDTLRVGSLTEANNSAGNWE
jgi:hypothetical protein